MPDTDNKSSAGRTVWPSATIVIAAVAVIFLLYFGHAFFVPIAMAVLFAILFRPVVRMLEQHRVPTAVGASVVMVVVLAGAGAAAFGLSLPLQSWAAKVPQSVAAAQAKLAQFRRPVQQLTRVADQLANPGEAGSGQPNEAAGARPPTISSPKAPGIIARVLGTTTSVLTGVVETVLLLWLLLASGDLFVCKFLALLPVAADRHRVSAAARETESVIVQYLVATTLINIGQAVAVGITVWLLGMPDAVLWAILTFSLEFIPYIGGALMVGLLTIVAFTTFDAIGHILAVPGAYLMITTLQNNLVSPVVYGHRLRLSPVAVLIGVLFWWALWGVPGAFLAVPMIAAAKVLGDHLPRLRALGELLGD